MRTGLNLRHPQIPQLVHKYFQSGPLPLKLHSTPKLFISESPIEAVGRFLHDILGADASAITDLYSLFRQTALRYHFPVKEPYGNFVDFLKKERITYDGYGPISNLFGYLAPEGDGYRYVVQRLEDWLFRVRELTLDYDKFRQVVRRILETCFDVKSRLISFEDYVNSPDLWGRSGAIPEFIKDKVRREFGLDLNMNKWSASLLTSRDLMRLDRSVNEAFVKPDEGDKLRVIVSTDLTSYLIQSYISLHIEKWYKAGNGLVAFENDVRQYFLPLMGAATNKISVDIDYYAWDENLNHVQAKGAGIIPILIEEVVRYFKFSEFESVLKKLMVEECYVDLRHLGVQRVERVRNGLLSGYRWTTLFNSLTNMAIHMMALEELGVRDYRIFVLGDDAHVVLRPNAPVREFLDRISGWGFTINTSKTKISFGGEFLKMNIKASTMFGEPLRAIRSILWVKPGKSEGSSLQSRAYQWARLYSRCLLSGLEVNIRNLRLYIKRDLYGFLRNKIELSRRVLMTIICSPSVIGGAGLCPIFGYGLKQVLGVIERKVVSKETCAVPSKIEDSLGIKFSALRLVPEAMKWLIRKIYWTNMHKRKGGLDEVRTEYTLKSFDMTLVNFDLKGVLQARDYFSTWFEQHANAWENSVSFTTLRKFRLLRQRFELLPETAGLVRTVDRYYTHSTTEYLVREGYPYSLDNTLICIYGEFVPQMFSRAIKRIMDRRWRARRLSLNVMLARQVSAVLSILSGNLVLGDSWDVYERISLWGVRRTRVTRGGT